MDYAGVSMPQRSQILLQLALVLGSARAGAAVCPDLASRACLESIKQNLDNFEFARARADAETQCYAAEEQNTQFQVQALVATVAGCHYLFTIERFLDNGMRALEARERARRIAAWGCHYGHAELCEAQIALFADALRELKGDIVDGLRNAEAKQAGLFAGTALREVQTAKILPRSFAKQASELLSEALAQVSNSRLAPCPECRPRIGETKGVLARPEVEKVLDAHIAAEGGGIVLELRLFEARSFRLLWEARFATKDLNERQRLFGFGSKIPDKPLHNRTIDEYEPSFKTLIGIGTAQLANTSGTALDRDRAIVTLRSTERFNQRRDEFGLMLVAHMTRRQLAKKNGEAEASVHSKAEAILQSQLAQDAAEAAQEAEAAAPEGVQGNGEAPTEAAPEDPSAKPKGDPNIIPAYPTAVALYGIYNHLFFAGQESYDSLRPAINLALGGYVSSRIMAPSARLGVDLFFGKRYAFSVGGIYVGPTSALYKGKEIKVPKAIGSDFVLSLSF